MQYIIAAVIGVIVVVPLGLFLAHWDNKRHAQTKEMIENAQDSKKKNG